MRPNWRLDPPPQFKSNECAKVSQAPPVQSVVIVQGNHQPVQQTEKTVLCICSKYPRFTNVLMSFKVMSQSPIFQFKLCKLRLRIIHLREPELGLGEFGQESSLFCIFISKSPCPLSLYTQWKLHLTLTKRSHHLSRQTYVLMSLFNKKTEFCMTQRKVSIPNFLFADA